MHKNYKFICEEKYTTIDVEQLTKLKKLARENEGRVFRYNLHSSFEDDLQEMVICIFSGSVNDIHKHLDKSEVIQVLEGQCLIEFFDENVELQSEVVLGKGNVSFCRVNKGVWHRVSPIGESCIIHEVSNGPFNPTSMVRHK